MSDAPLDCLVIGAGPAGLTAALYLARFRRRVAVLDAGEPRAAWIPATHNIPFFAEGIPGPELLAVMRDHLARYRIAPRRTRVAALRRDEEGFLAETAEGPVRARRVILATGAVDVEPDLPDVPDAVRRGLVRYCPVCDGFEARGQRIAVIGHGARGAGEAAFIARSWAADVTLLTLGGRMELDPPARARLAEAGVTVAEEPVTALEERAGRIAALRLHGRTLAFDTVYSALGLRYRTELALALGARADGQGALEVNGQCRTSIPGLYAAGDIVQGLDQIVVGMGHAAIAATRIHNRGDAPPGD